MSKLCISCGESMASERTICAGCKEPLHVECGLMVGKKRYCDGCLADGTATKKDAPKEPEFVIPDVIRRSYINTYQQCPYKFYLEVIKQIPIPPNPYTQVGIDLHELFEKISINPTSYHINEMKHDFEQMWNGYSDTLFTSEKQKETMQTRAAACIENMYKNIHDFPIKPYSTEERLITDIGDTMPKISTTADRIDLIGGELVVSDWKTGKTMYGQKLATDLQAPLYIYAIQQHFQKPVSRFNFYYLENNAIRTFERIDEDKFCCEVRKTKYTISLTEAIREVKTIFSRIKSKAFNPGTGKGMYANCKLCYYKESGNCQGADLESWRTAKYDNYKFG